MHLQYADPALRLSFKPLTVSRLFQPVEPKTDTVPTSQQVCSSVNLHHTFQAPQGQNNTTRPITSSCLSFFTTSAATTPQRVPLLTIDTGMSRVHSPFSSNKHLACNVRESVCTPCAIYIRGRPRERHQMRLSMIEIELPVFAPWAYRAQASRVGNSLCCNYGCADTRNMHQRHSTAAPAAAAAAAAAAAPAAVYPDW
jgi:hypothetical protein